MEATDKIKVSQFEYAITEICCPEKLHNYEAYTEAEERQMRIDNINRQLSRIKTKDGRKLAVSNLSQKPSTND